MERKPNLSPTSQTTVSLSNGLPSRGNKPKTSKETSPNRTAGENTKAVNHSSSKGTGSESMGGATPLRTGQKAAESSSVNKNKIASGTSAATSKRTSTKLQKPASTASTQSNPKSASQAGVSSSATNGPPKLREFNVTHLSDNWKRRKAEKLAAIEREKAKFAAALKNVSVSETKNDSTAATEVTGTSDLKDEQKTAMREPIIQEEDEDIESESEEIPAKDLLFPMNGLKGDATSKLEQLELLLKENKLEANGIIQSNGFVDFGDSDDDKKPKPKDFDIDKSPSESETEEEPEVSPRSKNKTLMAYMTACAKSGLKPNPTFMRQCGRSLIDMRNRMLTHRDAKPIAIALVADRRTSLLDLSDNPLGPQGTTCIAEMMYANESIMELNLSNTDVGTEGLEALAQTLPNNRSIRRLHLDNNKLQEGDGRHLAKLVTSVPDLRELNLNQTTLGFKDGTRLALALASDAGNLNTLSLQYNNIRTESAVQLALSLGKNTSLKSLNLAWNGFGADGCRALAKALGENNTLTELDLTNNRLGITSLEHIVTGLKKNSSLKSVKFGTNPLTTEGAKALVTALEQTKDTSVEELDLRGIPVDQKFLDMAASLQESKGITVLHDTTIQMGTSSQTKQFDGDNLDRFDPVMVLFEYMKKDNLRVIDLFQFLDQKKRDKLSKKDIRDGVNILRLPFTEHALDQIMKALDRNRDGFIQLDDMMKGYKENESAVKQRRIKANRRGKPDRGLEDLWEILKALIAKRKTDNEKRSQQEQLQKSRKSLTQAQIQEQLQTPRKSLTSAQLQEQLKTPRKSLIPGQLQEQLKTHRNSLIPGQLQEQLKTPRKSLAPAQLHDQLKTPRKSLAPAQLQKQLQTHRKSLI